MGSNELLRAPELLFAGGDVDHPIVQADQHLVAVLEAEGRLSQIGLFWTVKILHNLCHTEES